MAGKYYCSREETGELEGSAEKSSDLFGNLSPVVRFVFLAARGLSGRATEEWCHGVKHTRLMDEWGSCPSSNLNV